MYNGNRVGYERINIIDKVDLNEGMNNFVFVACKEGLATMTILPFSYFLQRYIM